MRIYTYDVSGILIQFEADFCCVPGNIIGTLAPNTSVYNGELDLHTSIANTYVVIRYLCMFGYFAETGEACFLATYLQGHQCWYNYQQSCRIEYN